MRSGIAVALLLLSAVLTASQNPIQHVVVLVLENRSFDHMLGHLMRNNSNIDGIYGNETNPINPFDLSQGIIKVQFNAENVDPSPGHSITDDIQQIFGGANASQNTALMNGFVANGIANGIGDGAMSMLNFTTAPVMASLAQDFAIFDKWFSSVPGPTQVNRMYVASATSHGAGTNDDVELALGYPQKPIFESLTDAGVSWGSFYEDWPCTLFLKWMRDPSNLPNFHTLDKFADLAAKGELPTYSYLEPRYFAMPDLPANDQHPSHSVSEGEMLIKRVYEIVRASPKWNNTLLLVTYDEHGGFYDHVPTPLEVPSPDGINSTDPPFDFKRIGLRVPMVMVSPYIDAYTVVHEGVGPTPTSQYEHSSIPATLKNLFNLPEFLTERDAWASTFENVVMGRSEPRTDCPMTLPEPPLELMAKPFAYKQELSELQWSILDLAAYTAKETLPLEHLHTEEDGGNYLRELAKRYFGNRD